MGIYLDNAATSWPKPKSVIKAMKQYFARCGGNPGRSGHTKAIEAGRIVLAAREAVSKLFNITDPSRIIFTKNATEALNIVLFGSLGPGDHLITTSMEHNSVLRPVRKLEESGVRLSIIEGDPFGTVDPNLIIEAMNTDTRLVCVNHASNVTGTVQEIAPIAEACRQKSVPLLLDAAQTAGAFPIDCKELGIDFLAASGHKGLLGPQGTGFLYVRSGADPRKLRPLMMGGTGSLSDREGQPDFFPDFLESGTMNVIGLAGLASALEFLLSKGIETIREGELKMIDMFLQKLSDIRGVKIYGPADTLRRTGVVSITIDGVSPSKIGEFLDKDYGIFTRIGLHCAPRAHKTIGTFPEGTVRFGLGPFTKKREIEAAAKAVREISKMGSVPHLEGVITFYGSHQAIRAEKVLNEAGFEAVLIPGPREISPNCGVALRFDYSELDKCRRALVEKSVNFEKIHHYPE